LHDKASSFKEVIEKKYILNKRGKNFLSSTRRGKYESSSQCSGDLGNLWRENRTIDGVWGGGGGGGFVWKDKRIDI